VLGRLQRRWWGAESGAVENSRRDVAAGPSMVVRTREELV
jgi:hypothetical protein